MNSLALCILTFNYKEIAFFFVKAICFMELYWVLFWLLQVLGGPSRELGWS